MRSATMMLTTVLLLGSASVSSAECAWVLWVEDEQSSAPGWTVQTSWVLMQAYSNETECRKFLRKGLEQPTIEESADKHMMYKVTGDTLTILYFPKDFDATTKSTHRQVFRFLCLPDTIDPREEKAP